MSKTTYLGYIRQFARKISIFFGFTYGADMKGDVPDRIYLDAVQVVPPATQGDNLCTAYISLLGV